MDSRSPGSSRTTRTPGRQTAAGSAIRRRLSTSAAELRALARLARWAPPGVHHVLAVLAEAGGTPFIVGGAVRDALLGRATHDFDVATRLPPGRVADLFPRVVRAGEKHGTIMVLTPEGPVEVTTFRSEGAYLDGRRPSTVEFHDDLWVDLARRDFTINAMAADLGAGRIVDPFGGLADLTRRVVRCVGEPAARFGEDGLRLLRAVRFAGVLAFRLDRRTRDAIPGAVATFERVSWERKRDELTRLLAEGQRPRRSVTLLESSGLLAALAPELVGVPPARLAALDRVPRGRPWQRFAVWAIAARLSSGQAGDILRRLRVANDHTRAVEVWVQAVSMLPVDPPSGADLRRWLASVGAPFAQAASQVAAAARGPRYRGFEPRVRAALARQPVLRVEQLAVRGGDLLALGLDGPRVGSTLRSLLDLVLESPSRNRRDELLAIAHRLSTGEP